MTLSVTKCMTLYASITYTPCSSRHRFSAILENYADGVDPNLYAAAAQFEFDTVGFRYSVAISTNINFDRRRHRHLEGEEHSRALSNDGLANADWSVAFSMACAPNSACAVLVEFFEVRSRARWI
jgi:hypothetical protein